MAAFIELEEYEGDKLMINLDHIQRIEHASDPVGAKIQLTDGTLFVVEKYDDIECIIRSAGRVIWMPSIESAIE